MGKAWEHHEEAELDATPEQVWEAIATGPGIDSWFMGRSSVEPGLGGTIRTDLGDFAMESTVTAWEPGSRLAYRSNDQGGGRFIAYEYLIEAREHGSTVVRVVAHGFLPGDDWETEYDAMVKGGQMYFRTLVAYVTHFAGRAGTSVGVVGPSIADWPTARATLWRAMGDSDDPAVGDRVRFTPSGLAPIVGVVDFVNPDAIGIRTDDALYRFIRGFFDPIFAQHHIFRSDVDPVQTGQAWRDWLTRVLG
ncbi:MAG TPA: SRPBCC domain-containing protein [Pilimelia sp.]|nr:SRPBCC domain-containing protein [Pilimelia sp.]